jgi:Icc-related predicted phosphoesterase
VDFVLYAGDDIGRFEEEGLNLFSELSTYTRSGQVLAVIGNDDSYVQKRVLKGDGIHDLYDRSFVYHNFAFIGLESVTRGPALFRHTETDFDEHLRCQIKETRRRRVVVLSHTPPYGILDRGIRFAELDEDETHHIGSTSLRHFIETESVDLVVCGHCHSNGRMVERLRKTAVANVSSHDAHGSRGNIAIIELTKDGAVDIEWHDTTEILGNNSLMQIHGIGPVRAEYLARRGVKNITQLSRIRDLANMARKSGISLSRLRTLQLKARSFLENRTYQVKPFSLVKEKAIFFDIETDTACERVWLIGLQIDGRFIQLYADNWVQEKMILKKFIDILKENPDYGLISYSTTNFDYRITLKAIKRHKLSTESLTSRCHRDLGTLLEECFIFPGQTYALKDLGSFLGYKFKYPELDGLMVALSYQRHVEENKPLDPKILKYNGDDVRVLPYMIDKLTSGEFSISAPV